MEQEYYMVELEGAEKSRNNVSTRTFSTRMCKNISTMKYVTDLASPHIRMGSWRSNI